ncbi:hypothetical protein I3842_15G148900 [Carya illinoinensis]|uniref:Uncharacterized protein n=1 Tax=Carya illinoinensis TaxID=32201 RepID=A0A922A9E3_CARIL|nr:hypothetical protein I3842_15G148900 [Carya illinoinensis]
MKIAVLVWLFFIVSLKLLTYSACQSTFTPKAEDKPYLSPRKQLNCKHLIISVFQVDLCNKVTNEDQNWSVIILFFYADLYDRNREAGDQRRNEAVQAARPLRVSQKAKAVYGGANDLKHPRNSHSGANSILVRPCLGFSVLLRHVVLGLLLLVFFF